MSHVFRHPKYYKELRKRNRDLSELQQVKLERSVPQSDQAISSDNAPNMDRAHDGERERAPGPGPKLPDSTMVKQRASSSTSRDQDRTRAAYDPASRALGLGC